jgi:IclR family acetate operon transcriptional repressor
MSIAGDGQEARPGTQAVERALAILECFRSERSALGITDIARAVGLNVSTAHRLMRALVAAGFMEQDPVTERYRLGIEIAVLGQRALEHAGYHLAKPVLVRLAEATGESVSLGVRRNTEVVVIEQAASSQPLRFDHPAGAEIQLHASGMGKVLLAFSGVAPEAAVAQLTELTHLPRFTDHTICDADVLAATLVAIRGQGYAVNHEERYAGVSGVAAPVLGASGVARAAVGVQGPALRLTPARAAAIAPLVRQAADEIAQLAIQL